tara:strand:- start:38 stop:799 length:762 start_codon:yes stop_codon:yes gene_type:complete
MKHNKMSIWNDVCTTDPKYTKYVNQRGGFTAIDAQYQVRTATEQFGPMGWGWGVKDETFNFIEGMVIYQAILFYHFGSDGNKRVANEIPLHSSMQVKPDCVKAVATDALTKGLSKLGFNADVFLGKFDNQKYVDDLKKKYAEEPTNKTITKDDGSQFPPQQTKRNGDLSERLQDQVDKAKSQMNGGSNGQAESSDDVVIQFGTYEGMTVEKAPDTWITWAVRDVINKGDTFNKQEDPEALTQAIMKRYNKQVA